VGVTDTTPNTAFVGVLVGLGDGIVCRALQAQVICLQVRGIVPVHELFLGHVPDVCHRTATAQFGDRFWRLGVVLRRRPGQGLGTRMRHVWLEAATCRAMWDQVEREHLLEVARLAGDPGSELASEGSVASGEVSIDASMLGHSPGSSRASSPFSGSPVE